MCEMALRFNLHKHTFLSTLRTLMPIHEYALIFKDHFAQITPTMTHVFSALIHVQIWEQIASLDCSFSGKILSSTWYVSLVRYSVQNDMNLVTCEFCRGLSKQGMVDQPAFAATLQLVVECHEQKPLEPRLMRQLFQAVTSARLQGIAPQIPEDLEKTAHKW